MPTTRNQRFAPFSQVCHRANGAPGSAKAKKMASQNRLGFRAAQNAAASEVGFVISRLLLGRFDTASQSVLLSVVRRQDNLIALHNAERGTRCSQKTISKA
jgi:hypothetical protein